MVTPRLQIENAVQALALESQVAHRQHLVDEQNGRLNMDGHGERGAVSMPLL